ELLRRALEAPAERHDEAEPHREPLELAQALAAAVRPRALTDAENEALLERGFAIAGKRVAARRKPRSRFVPVLVGAGGGVLALAAGLLLFLRVADEGAKPVSANNAPAPVAVAAAYIPARSASDLFDADTPFPRAGGETARIDRIATRRAA